MERKIIKSLYYTLISTMRFLFQTKIISCVVLYEQYEQYNIRPVHTHARVWIHGWYYKYYIPYHHVLDCSINIFQLVT